MIVASIWQQAIYYTANNLLPDAACVLNRKRQQWRSANFQRWSAKSSGLRAIPVTDKASWIEEEEEVQEFSLGPLSGDLAEIEAFCRIQRLAEQLHRTVMESLRRLESADENVGARGVFSSSLEEKVVAGLGCIGATLHQGRLDILGGYSNEEEERLPRLARFRSKLRGCCSSLRTSLQSLLPAKGDQNLAVYRILHRLTNVCLDAGFPRPDGAPCYGHIPNFATVKLQKGDENLVEFWRGGNINEEGLEWLLQREFKTIVDLRDEDPQNELAEAALMKAEASGRIRRVRIPVSVQTAPTMEQVREFADIVSDAANRPVFLQSYAGVVRASAMVSRWREFVLRGGLDRNCSEPMCTVEDIFLEETPDKASESSKVAANMLRTTSPFEAQMPGPDVFSRMSMARFFKRKRTLPGSARRQRRTIYSRLDPDENAQNGRFNAKVEVPSKPSGGSTNGRAGGRAKEEDDNGAVQGDMCASKTGVVRLQSRKKAEMYLVRTDGYSCTRERVTESTLAFTHPSTQQQMLMWKTAPKTVLLLKKLGEELMEEAKQVASFLYNHEGMNVMVEPDVHDRFARFPGFGFIQTFYNHDIGELHERVDFVVCLGGDGVILHASNLFRSAVPPVVSFNLGSLGFLTAHPFEDFKQDLRAVIHGNRIEGVYVTLRMRLRCEIVRDGQPVSGKVFEVLNEVVVDRGSNPYLCKIECYERNRLITKVQADGVLVATPTGSTAYSTAAGGSMVHPNVPCMLFTPICPHSLSFRPVILPDSAILELKVPSDSRSNAWVSFDGKKRQQLTKGDLVRIHMGRNPMPTVNKSDQTSDWFRSLDRCFNWSARKEQMALLH
ncbi:probable NAD kinase 2, chloroplastic isoform X2 [Selaginella moellendorffii]|nr:probable NAD kinase 2, chloroplastic isoform X2 [Selaginella moellendorffii]XP_024541731.1 probable NAD kinase 2, chloroplastic isoform X2 [Selaginella moellendorffii]|eukprot:XP_002981035.2 probable NAD kinase 2, chloroplastic isoform X2 [Selaginella moellendorffii]